MVDMRNEPQRIYLQVGEDVDKDTDFDELGDVTWCAENIYKTDLHYINVVKLKISIKRLISHAVKNDFVTKKQLLEILNKFANNLR